MKTLYEDIYYELGYSLISIGQDMLGNWWEIELEQAGIILKINIKLEKNDNDKCFEDMLLRNLKKYIKKR